jgi:hypothetical protein
LKTIFISFFLRYWANQKIVVAVAVVAVVALQIKTSKEEEEFFKGKSVHERAAWF